MSRKVDICDLCGARYPEYKFKYKALKYIFDFSGGSKEKYDICDKCWDKLGKLVKAERAGNAPKGTYW